MARFDVAILGAGPVGLIAALQIARSGRSVLVIAPPPAGPEEGRRIDAVPAAFLAFLADAGLSPAAVGADRLSAERHAAWETAIPQTSPAPKTAHVERPALEAALLAALRREHRATIQLVPRRLSRADGFDADRWGAGKVIDASGRTAVTASARVKPTKPWVARTFWMRRGRCKVAPEFAIASLPGGYAYRLGTASAMTAGVVGRGASIFGSASDIELHLRKSAPWLLEGLPSLARMTENKARPASVQWTQGHANLRIGDAALARDALSSQGIVTGTSEALLAAAWRDDGDLRRIRMRQVEQRRAHLMSLLGVIDRCRYADHPVWRDYRAFVAAHADAPLQSSAALRHGKVERVDVDPPAAMPTR
jgi:flavin-dependent dehydrogenase